MAMSLDANVAFEPVGGDLTAQVLSAMPPSSTVYVYGNLSHQQL
jgi:hypothetical protein